MRAEVGKEAPDFTLQTERNKTWRLSDHRGNVVVLLFYPKDETLVCTRQMCSVRDNWNKYLETKAEIVGVSGGKVSEHLAFAQNHNLPLTLLADSGRKVTKTYINQYFFPLWFYRAVIIIDGEGIIRTHKVMLSVFRPNDTGVISAIYAARTDSLQARYDELLSKIRKRRR